MRRHDGLRKERAHSDFTVLTKSTFEQTIAIALQRA